MQYDWKKIGERLKSEREALKLSMDELASEIHTTRQTISKWEKGTSVEITLNMLLELCRVFDCELGYLLCEYDCKTRAATDISQQTGLSEEAVKNLCSLNDTAKEKTSKDYYHFSCAYLPVSEIIKNNNDEVTHIGRSHNINGILISNFRDYFFPYNNYFSHNDKNYVNTERQIILFLNDLLQSASNSKTTAWEKLSKFAEKYAEYKYQSLCNSLWNKSGTPKVSNSENDAFFLMKYMLDFIEDITNSYITKDSLGTRTRKDLEEFIAKHAKGTICEEEEDG